MAGRENAVGLLLTPGSVLDLGSGVLLLGLAAFVLHVRPRRRTNKLFAVFSGCLGLGFTLGNLVTLDDPLNVPLALANSLLFLPASVGLVLLATRVPDPLPRVHRRVLWGPAAAAAAFWLYNVCVAHLIPYLLNDLRNGYPLTGLLPPLGAGPVAFVAALIDFQGPAITFFGLDDSFLQSAFLFAMLLVAKRYPRGGAEHQARGRQAAALFCAAIVVYPGTRAGIDLMARFAPAGSPQEVSFLASQAQYGLGILLVHGVVAARWLANTRRGSPADTKTARNVALAALAGPATAMALTPFLGGYPAVYGSGLLGLARIVAFSLLGYAILQHQLLGIDAKAKLTVRRGTVAGAFLATYLVVSQLVQNLTGSELGPIAGAVAAGVLLFGLSPLQRAAARFADGAMPGTKALADLSGAERARKYRDSAVVAWADGVITLDERALLDSFRTGLELSPEVAHRLEGEAAVLAAAARAGAA